MSKTNTATNWAYTADGYPNMLRREGKLMPLLEEATGQFMEYFTIEEGEGRYILRPNCIDLCFQVQTDESCDTLREQLFAELKRMRHYLEELSDGVSSLQAASEPPPEVS